MTATTRVGTIAKLTPMRNSRHANPRWKVALTDGSSYTTQPDAACAFGLENSEYRAPNRVRLTIERNLITHVEPIGPRPADPVEVEIWRDGEYVTTTADPLAWFHREHSFSMAHAIAHEGYLVRDADDSRLCNCSHAMVQAHSVAQCSWDAAEARSDLAATYEAADPTGDGYGEF